MFSKKRLEALENRYIQDYLQMKSDIERLNMRTAYKADSDDVARIDDRVSDLEMKMTHVDDSDRVTKLEERISDLEMMDKRFSKLEDRFEDLWKENCELQVFKDFVEQLIRDISDNMIDISVYVEELQKVFNNAAELTDEPYHKRPSVQSYENNVKKGWLNENDAED